MFYLIIVHFAKSGQISCLMEILSKRGSVSSCISVLFYRVLSVHNRSPLMENAICPSLLFFEFRYLFWLVYKSAQLQAKKSKVNNMRHDFSERPHSLCAVCIAG